MLLLCSFTCLAQPQATSSTSAGSIPVCEQLVYQRHREVFALDVRVDATLTTLWGPYARHDDWLSVVHCRHLEVDK